MRLQYFGHLLESERTYNEDCDDRDCGALNPDDKDYISQSEDITEFDFIPFNNFDENGFLKEEHYEHLELDTYDDDPETPIFTTGAYYWCGCSKNLIYHITSIKRAWSLKTAALAIIASIKFQKISIQRYKKKYKDVLLELYYKPGRGIGYMTAQNEFNNLKK